MSETHLIVHDQQKPLSRRIIKICVIPVLSQKMIKVYRLFIYGPLVNFFEKERVFLTKRPIR